MPAGTPTHRDTATGPATPLRAVTLGHLSLGCPAGMQRCRDRAYPRLCAPSRGYAAMLGLLSGTPRAAAAGFGGLLLVPRNPNPSHRHHRWSRCRRRVRSRRRGLLLGSGRAWAALVAAVLAAGGLVTEWEKSHACVYLGLPEEESHVRRGENEKQWARVRGRSAVG